MIWIVDFIQETYKTYTDFKKFYGILPVVDVIITVTHLLVTGRVRGLTISGGRR